MTTLIKPRGGADKELDRLMDNLEVILEDVLTRAVISGRLVEDVVVTTGQANTVNHRLGRKLRGWVVVRKSADANVWDEQATNELQSKELVLQSDATVTVSLWVF